MDYNFVLKNDRKIEEEEVMELLNEDLKNMLTVYINGKILKSVDVFELFPLEFLSNLTFVLRKKQYFLDDHIFDEGEVGVDIYFITQGRVSLIHK